MNTDRRTGRTSSMLEAVKRYLETPDACVLFIAPTQASILYIQALATSLGVDTERVYFKTPEQGANWARGRKYKSFVDHAVGRDLSGPDVYRHLGDIYSRSLP